MHKPYLISDQNGQDPVLPKEDPVPEDLPEPMLPQPFRPVPAPRRRRRPEVWREFDPTPHTPRRRNQPPPSTDLEALFDDQKFEGVETRRGQDLNKDNTEKMTNKIRAEVNTSFYLRHIFGYLKMGMSSSITPTHVLRGSTIC